MIPSFFLVAGSAIAASQPAPSTPYAVAKASDLMVNYAVKNRASGVPENVARSAAVEIVNSALAPPQATKLVNSAVSYAAVNGFNVNGEQAKTLVSKASSYYDNLATQPAYKGFADLVHEKSSLFDVSGAYNQAQANLLNLGSQHGNSANKIANAIVGKYQNVKSDSTGAQAIVDARALGRKVAGDFQVDADKVKAVAKDSKSKFANMLALN